MYDGSGDSSVLVQEEGGMPFDMAARSGEVYYTEMLERSVIHFGIDDPADQNVFCTLEEFPFKLDVLDKFLLAIFPFILN